MEDKEEIQKQIWQEITAIEAYMTILAQCEKGLIQNAILEEKSTYAVLQKRTEDLDVIIDLVNTLENIAFIELELPPRDECIYLYKC